MNKVRKYFIGDILEKTDDVFDKAKAILLLRLIFMFLGIYCLPTVSDYFAGNTHIFMLDIFAFITLFLLPFVIKYQKNISKSTNIFLTLGFILIFLAQIIINPLKSDPLGISWVFCFLILSALLQKGLTRILFCCFFQWIPLLYLAINTFLNGAITIGFLFQPSKDDAPIFLIIIPISIAIYAVWTNALTVQDAKKTITKQKADIDDKNKKITDSINYAKRIQNARLPTKEYIKSALPNSFVLFKPKDIVSGDFYFFLQKKQTIFVAAADCTGHGVPGAFMSMIGFEKLEDAVLQGSQPSEMLKMLNIGIKTSLRQSESEASTKDGMDIGLCAIDLETKMLHFAGANRPLWIIRNQKNEVEEIKATKKAIGGFTENNQIFESTAIQLHQGDAIYMSTDGYADQFGHATKKKLMTKKLKELLLEIQPMQMAEQLIFLDNYLQNWKGATKQLDDILIIGIKIS